MIKSRYTDSQILSILKQNEAAALLQDLCREHGMSNATFEEKIKAEIVKEALEKKW
jgi:putative transposase